MMTNCNIIRPKILSAYRKTLRSARDTFGKDITSLSQFNLKFRERLQTMIEEDAEEAAKFTRDVGEILSKNVAQGEISMPKNRPTIKLRIDPSRHELGDNDSRFQGKSIPEMMNSPKPKSSKK